MISTEHLPRLRAMVDRQGTLHTKGNLMQSNKPLSFACMLLAMLIGAYGSLALAQQGPKVRFSNWEFDPMPLLQKVEQTADKLVYKLDKSVPGAGGTVTLQAGKPLKGTLAATLDGEWKRLTAGRKFTKTDPDDDTALADGTKVLRRSAMTATGGFFSVTAFAAPNGVNLMLMDAADEMATQMLGAMTFGFFVTVKLHPVGGSTALAQADKPAAAKPAEPASKPVARVDKTAAQKPPPPALGTAGGKARFISHKDLARIPERRDECPKMDAVPIDANAPHPVQGLIGGAKLTYAQTMANLQALLEATAPTKAIETLRASPIVRDPGSAERLVSGAIYGGQPSAALGLLLTTHQNAPKDPLLLINLAGLSNYLGLYREALTLLDEAEKLKPPSVKVGGMNLRAILLSNRGYALNATGRPKEAETSLLAAIKLEPDLAEAYTNAAYALGAQGECKRAGRFLHAGNTRRPATIFAMKDPPPRIPPAEVIDLSRGRTGQIPAMHLATTPEEGADENLKKRVRKIADEAEKGAQTALEQQMRFTPQAQRKRASWAGRGTTGTVSAERAEWLVVLSQEYAEEISILIQLAGVPGQVGKRYARVLGGAEVPSEVPRHPDPDLQPKIEAVMRTRLEMVADRLDAIDRFTEQRTRAYRAYDEEDRNCQRLRDPRLCQAGAALRRDTAICSAGKEADSMRIGSMTAFNAAYRDLYGEAFRRLNAVASYFSDRDHHSEAQARINVFANVSTGALAGQVGEHNEQQANGAAECRAANKRMVDLVTDYLKMLEAEKCNAGGTSGKIEVGVVEVSANCEEVSAGLSTPGLLGLFVKVGYEQSMRYEYVKAGKERFLAQQAGLDGHIRPHFGEYGAAFDGKITVYAGAFAKTGTPGISADAKVGGSFSIDGKGNMRDFSFKSEGSVSAAKGVGVEQTVFQGRTALSPSPAQN